MSTSIVRIEMRKPYLSDLDKGFVGKANAYLIGETSLVMEGWRPWTRQIEICADVLWALSRRRNWM